MNKVRAVGIVILLAVLTVGIFTIQSRQAEGHETPSEVFHHEHLTGYHDHVHEGKRNYDGICEERDEDGNGVKELHCDPPRNHARYYAGPECEHYWREIEGERNTHEHPCGTKPTPIPVPTQEPVQEEEEEEDKWNGGDWHYHNWGGQVIYHRHAPNDHPH